MKVTNTGIKGSQFPMEGSTRKDSAEHEGYAGAHDPERIAETDGTNANKLRNGLLQMIWMEFSIILNLVFHCMVVFMELMALQMEHINMIVLFMRYNQYALEIIDFIYRNNYSRII